MNASIGNIATYMWLDHNSIGSPTSHDSALLLFRDSVIRPSLRVLESAIDDLRNGDDEVAAAFLAEELAEVFQATVEGYLLTVQSMWERGLRGLLILRDKKLCNSGNVASLEGAHWGTKPQQGKRKTLQDHFQWLMGVSIQDFDTYADLDLLQSFGNAIRHGDGNAARRIHQLCPSLWWNWMPPGTKVAAGAFRFTMPNDSPRHPTFASITLPLSVLEQMIQSVLWFWEDIENMRCNSFKNKHVSVVRKLAMWEEHRLRRESSRVWTPN